MNHLIEIRTLTLKPNSREEFHRLYIEEALPLLQRWNFDVVAHGPSRHGENTYYVIRGYESLSQRDEMEDAYYASDDWRQGPRKRILALIESYTDIFLEVDDVTIQVKKIEASIISHAHLCLQRPAHAISPGR